MITIKGGKHEKIVIVEFAADSCRGRFAGGLQWPDCWIFVWEGLIGSRFHDIFRGRHVHGV
jgi:hypothetical protein